MARKRKHVEFETIALTEECSLRVMKKLPKNLKDPKSFTLPIQTGKDEVGHALCDLGESIKLMPIYVFETLGLGEPYLTTITLRLADRSRVQLKGVSEDMLIKVGKFVIPADIII